MTTSGGAPWVYRHSPYKGATFAVHVALGDVANDLHDDEVWATQANIAAKARVSRQSANTALGILVADGFLAQLEDNAKAGKPNRYRVMYPDVEPVWSTRGVSSTATPPVSTTATGVSAPATGGVVHGDTEPKGTKAEPELPIETRAPSTVVAFDPDADNPEGEAFARFWAAYPRGHGKGAARKAWPKAVRIAGDAEVIVAGAERFAVDPNRSDEYTPHASTWLNAERWSDPPLPARSVRGAPSRRPIAERRTGTAEVDRW